MKVGLRIGASDAFMSTFPMWIGRSPAEQVNNPDPKNGGHIRTLEWKHMLPEHEAKASVGTVLTREYPIWPGCPDEFEYPFPDFENQQLVQSYELRAKRIPKLLVCGRLGEYRYYDMDQALARALLLAKRLLTGNLSLQAPCDECRLS